MGPAVGAENSLKTLKFKALVIFLKKNIFVEKCAVFCTIIATGGKDSSVWIVFKNSMIS